MKFFFTIFWLSLSSILWQPCVRLRGNGTLSFCTPPCPHRIQANGGKVVRRRVERWADVAEDFDVIFNCTGLGAAKLCNDHTVIPVRGQVYKVLELLYESVLCYTCIKSITIMHD